MANLPMTRRTPRQENAVRYASLRRGTGAHARDFAVSRELPSHPELLNWLAVEFRASRWDVKRLFRLVVESSTYRQSGATTAEKHEKDPHDRLLPRRPRIRMIGEMIRDAAPSSSRLLVAAPGDPSLKPYQSEGVDKAVAVLESDTHFCQPHIATGSIAAASTPSGNGAHPRRRWMFSIHPAARPARLAANRPTPRSRRS